MRSSCKARLQAELAEARTKITELSRRRGANQRKLREVNLADRRAAVALQKQRSLEAAFRSSAVRAEANDAVADRVAELERALADTQAQLKAAQERA